MADDAGFVLGSGPVVHNSEICRALHGHVFEVRKAMGLFDRVSALDDPGKIAEERPWISQGSNEDGAQVLYYNRGEERQVVATVERSGAGELDAAGTYSGMMDDAELEAAGVMVPPFHGHCRTTILAEM